MSYYDDCDGNLYAIDQHLKEREDYEYNLECKVEDKVYYRCTGCQSEFAGKDYDCCDGFELEEVDGYICGECGRYHDDFDKAKYCCS